MEVLVLSPVQYLADVVLMVRMILHITHILFALLVVFVILLDQLPAFSLIGEHKRNGQIPGVLLFRLVPLPVLDQVLSITRLRVPVMASEHTVPSLVELVDEILHSQRALVKRQIVLVHKSVD